MIACMDTSGIIYALLYQMSVNVTGSFFLSTFVVALFFFVLMGLFGFQFEVMMILLLPLHLSFLACLGADWLGLVGCLLIYLGIFLGKNFFFR